MPNVPTLHSRKGLALQIQAVAVGNPDIDTDLLIGDIYEALDKIQGVQVQGVETVPTHLPVTSSREDRHA